MSCAAAAQPQCGLPGVSFYTNLCLVLALAYDCSPSLAKIWRGIPRVSGRRKVEAQTVDDKFLTIPFVFLLVGCTSTFQNDIILHCCDFSPCTKAWHCALYCVLESSTPKLWSYAALAFAVKWKESQVSLLRSRYSLCPLPGTCLWPTCSPLSCVHSISTWWCYNWVSDISDSGNGSWRYSGKQL